MNEFLQTKPNFWMPYEK